MKMVKSLLLGSAAGLVAVTAGQAADLPVKAKPVEYVKVCSLYGAGFYYMPGTDLCIKVGGWVRAEAVAGNVNGNMTWGPFNGNALNRTTSNFVYRARGYITADVRSQSEYGTIRSYIAVGVNSNDAGLSGSAAAPATIFSSNRAFVQWAGMTAGLTQSFYDFYSVPSMQYRGGYLPASDTGDPGWMVWAWTAQLGGGVSATVSAETRRTTQIIDQNGLTTPGGGSIVPGSFITAGTAITGGAGIFPGNGAYGGEQMPDIVGNLRVDAAWGGAQIMGALHQVNASYYSLANAAGTAVAAPLGGNPSTQTGWAAGAGLKLNFPSMGPGDWFQAQFNATEGALRYLFFTPNSNWGMVNGASEAYGILSDCVYGGTVAVGNNTGCNLTSAWGFNAGYEHYWTPNFHTTLYGAWYEVKYDTQANNMLCEIAGYGNGLGGSLATAGTTGCSNNWSTWGIGSRTQWDVTKTFYLGVEVLYQDLHSATTGCGVVTPGGCPGGVVGGNTYQFGGASVLEADAHSWMVSVRAHRDFLP
jgi:hypothetical protein